MARRAAYTVWRPVALRRRLGPAGRQVRRVEAQHVILATVPRSRSPRSPEGSAGRSARSRATSPTTRGRGSTTPTSTPTATRTSPSDEARAIDSAIDAYNETIIDSVAAARAEGLDWYLFDIGGLLDRLATRRYIDSPWARPAWWTPYELPPQLQALDPIPDTRFFRSGRDGRTDGGLFSLDGVHPTTIGYGLIAQEVIKIMELAGVTFAYRDGTPRPGPITLDWDRVLAADTLITNPPAAISPTLSLLGWLDERIDWVRRILPLA